MDPAVGLYAALSSSGATKDVCLGLKEHYIERQAQHLALFVELRYKWAEIHPGRPFRGLCANINPLTGSFRPLAEQRYWGWGDARALATWCYLLNGKRVPDRQVVICVGDDRSLSVRLQSEMDQYVDVLYQGLDERYRANGNFIPFCSHVETGLEDENPVNHRSRAELIDATHLYAANGFLQYGHLRRNGKAIETGCILLERALEAAGREDYQQGREDIPPGSVTPVKKIIILGIIAELLDTLGRTESQRLSMQLPSEKLSRQACTIIGSILAKHYDPLSGRFWEWADDRGRPVAQRSGEIAVDPGHVAEFLHFVGALYPHLPSPGLGGCGDKADLLDHALALIEFIDRIGFSDLGLLSKYVDLNTGRFMPDYQAVPVTPVYTAPWWGVRELAAAALTLFTLTGRPRLLDTYGRAQRAASQFYLSPKIRFQMVQTVGLFTGEPMDIAPATGNFDAMHDARARAREIECLDFLLANDNSRKQSQ